MLWSKIGVYMKIDGNQNNSALSFSAIHPARFYVKCEDGEFHRVVSHKVIKSLRRKTVTWLNKDYYDEIRLTNGESIKKESVKDKALRERLVRFFVNRDPDYREKNIVRSFTTTNGFREPELYILTGKSAEIVDNAAKKIENFHSDLKERAEILSDGYGIELEKVKKYITDRSVFQQNAIKRNYHDSLKDTIENILKVFDPKNSLFEAYFVPHAKGKNITYELVDAKFNRK